MGFLGHFVYMKKFPIISRKIFNIHNSNLCVIKLSENFQNGNSNNHTLFVSESL